jgi:hypothetical protein
MAKHIYDESGKYKGKVLTQEEQYKKTQADDGIGPPETTITMKIVSGIFVILLIVLLILFSPTSPLRI